MKKIFITGSPLKMFYDFFHTPIKSSHLNIFSSKTVSEFKEKKMYSIDSVVCKLVAVKNDNNELVFIPLQHTL